MSFTCIAVDDEPLALELIQSYCSRFDGLSLKAVFTDAFAARDFLAKEPVDLVFLDIQMPDISGLDFFSQYARGLQVIFTTAFSDYAIRGFDLNAVDYLLKPFDYERFAKACEKAQRLVLSKKAEGPREDQYITIKSEYRIIQLAVDRIVHLESRDDYVKIFLQDGKFLMSKITTRAMQDKLPAGKFVRIHRSYIVNKSYVSHLACSSLKLGLVELPIGKNYKKDVMEQFTEMDFRK